MKSYSVCIEQKERTVGWRCILSQASYCLGNGVWQTLSKTDVPQTCKDVNKRDFPLVGLPRVLHLFGDMDPFGHLVKLILRVMLLIA